MRSLVALSTTRWSALNARPSVFSIEPDKSIPVRCPDTSDEQIQKLVEVRRCLNRKHLGMFVVTTEDGPDVITLN